MLFEEVGETARTLLAARGRSLGRDLTSIAREYASHSSQELADALAQAPRDRKAAVGLLLARVALEDAVANRSRELFDRFLFRFGAHLKLSVSEAGLKASERLALATAAELLFNALPSASAKQRAEASAMRSRFNGPLVSDDDWRSTLGKSHAEFQSTVADIARELGGRRRSTSKAPVAARLQKSEAVPIASVPTHELPPWLSLSFSGPTDSLVGSSANWEPDHLHGSPSASVELGWSAFREGKFPAARAYLEGIYATLGAGWGPTSGADSLRSWNWLRLVAELASAEAGEALDSRRAWTSACGFAHRCVPDDTDLIDNLLNKAIGDFVASDLASTRAWGAYTIRLVADLGSDVALSIYSNAQKAALRNLWLDQFSLEATDARSTASALAAIMPRFKRSTQKLYLAARDHVAPSRVLRETSHEFVPLLDEAEGVLFADCLELSQEVDRLTKAEGTTHRDLSELQSDLQHLQSALAVSGSAILQDFVAPLIEVARQSTVDASAELGVISRPDVKIELSSSKIPFSAAEGSTYDIRFRATNLGNAAAEAITLRVTQESMGIDVTGSLASLGPGAQADLSVQAIATGESEKAVTLQCEVQWTDLLLQQFSNKQTLSAEDQMRVAWTRKDVNPFSLGTISEPERLVGRADDLASLDSLLAGRASAYVTGQKRVGKTSLTRVLLQSAKEQRGWAGSLLPLGRALGQDQSAGDLVYALLDAILEAARETYGREVSDVSEVAVDNSGNFARAANKWLQAVARVLPSGARVVVAVDDFDELPAHLIKGPQADALFLFLRSLVDEPWLNLIVVGSEILPSIIQAQAHKLNQVVPVSVTNFSSRVSTAELLETPTSDRLEWLPESVDRVHYLCAGNPYYETLLAQRLWQTLRERSRSVVMASDVDEAARAIARETSDSHFVHLWADSSNGLDHTARSAIVASAVLRSIARGGGAELAPTTPEEVGRLAQGWIQTATTDELLGSIAVLQSRQVVATAQASDRLLVTIPLVGMWLQDAGGRALDGIYSTSKHATATVRMISDSDLVELSKNLRYRGDQVTEIRIKAWIEQFGGNDRQYLAYKMLRRMVLDGYFTSTRLQNTELPRLVTAVGQLGASRVLTREANNQNLRNAYLINHGVAGDSTQGVLSMLAKSLRIKKANIVRLSEIPSKVRTSDSEVVLFVLDDYCGTGTHLSGVLDELLEHVTSLGEDWIDRVRVVVGAAVVADEDDLPMRDGAIPVEVVGGTFLGERFRPFSDSSGVFDTVKEREDAEQMTMSIGQALVPNNPLGFGGRSLLTLFEFNCPNNVAPIFWKSGSVSGAAWTPLFDRMV